MAPEGMEANVAVKPSHFADEVAGAFVRQPFNPCRQPVAPPEAMREDANHQINVVAPYPFRGGDMAYGFMKRWSKGKAVS